MEGCNFANKYTFHSRFYTSHYLSYGQETRIIHPARLNADAYRMWEKDESVRC